MEAVGRVAGGIAHDFNNMLTVIQAAAEAIARDPAHDPIAIHDIREAASKGASLTRQLLTFSRREISQPQRTDVNGSISKLMPMIARILGANIMTEVRLAPGVPPVIIDPGQLDQVLVNLALNARDAMPEGGTLTVSTGVSEDAALALPPCLSASKIPGAAWTTPRSPKHSSPSSRAKAIAAPVSVWRSSTVSSTKPAAPFLAKASRDTGDLSDLLSRRGCRPSRPDRVDVESRAQAPAARSEGRPHRR